jgi:chemotaxis protein MotB
MDGGAGAEERRSGGHEAGGMMRWLLTYSDMITLLMAFFIMMYSMSVLNLDKFRRAAASLRAEFGPQVRARDEAGGGGVLAHPLPGADERAMEPQVQSVEDQLAKYIQENNLADVVRVRREPRGLVISLVSDNLLFPVGEADLRPPALAILDKIAVLLAGIPNPIVVEGHTCNLPIHTPRYPSNWELSAARACSVVRYLTDRWGLPPSRLAATGYADSRPVAANRTEEGRVQNRRVDVVVLTQSGEPGDDAPGTVGKQP